MKRTRNVVFGVFLAAAIVAARAQVYAWTGYDEWSGHYGSVLDSVEFKEDGNHFTYLADCDPENTFCIEELTSFCEGFYSVCEDYCIQTWPGPSQGVNSESCDIESETSAVAFCDCMPIE